MFRYLAVTWNHNDQAQLNHARRVANELRHHSPDLDLAFEIDGLMVFFSNEGHDTFSVYRAPDGAGIVLGRLFHRDHDGGSGFEEVVLDSTFSKTLWQSTGQSLLDRYWGRYIAFSRDSARQALLAMPDPTGECPCFLHQHHGLTLLFSEVSDVVSLKQSGFSVNWHYVVSRLFDPTRQLGETGLTDVEQLRAGEAVRIDAGGTVTRHLCWDLFRIAAEQPIDDFALATRHARHAVLTCVSAWGNCYPNIVHMLSGGIDSTIVLACLLRARTLPAITCLNVHDPMVGGDERSFARLAASAVHSPEGRRSALLECSRDIDAVRLDSLTQVRPSACPSNYLPNAVYRNLHRQAAEPRCAALFTGLGGDYIFYRTSSARPAVDYVHDHGLGRDLLRIVRDSTRSRTYWSVLRESIAGGIFKRPLPATPTPPDREFINPDIIEQCRNRRTDDSLPPWLAECAHMHGTCVAPNKQRQIESLYRPVRKHDPFCDQPPLQWCAPLLSQPIMEVFARIPVYLLKAGGIDRAVARKAFAPELPGPLLERRSKGVTNNFIHAVFQRHHDYFRELLLDGVLAREGLLNRPRLEAFMTDTRDGFARGFSGLMGNWLDLEIWLRSWSAHRKPHSKPMSGPPSRPVSRPDEIVALTHSMQRSRTASPGT